MNRRVFLRAALATGGLALLSACGPAAPNAPATAPTTTGGAAGGAAAGGTLRLALPSQLSSLDGHVLNQTTIDSLWHVFDRLTEYDAKLQPQPMLAESWDISSDATKITFHLRKGVKFQTGRDLTSDDVKANILRVRDPQVTAAQLAPQSAVWKTIDTPDAYTLTLTSDTPQPAMFDFFEYLNIIDPVTANGPDAATKAVGTGPFTLAEWTQGERLTLKRNPSYWQTGLPKLDQLVVTFASEVKAMITLLEGKAVDLVINPSLTDVERLRSDPSYQLLSSKTPGTLQEFIVNTTAPGLENPAVRQALNYAMDRQRMVDSVRRGVGQAQALPWAPSSPAYDAAKNSTYAFDLDKARTALQQAGASGLTFDLVFSTTGDASNFAQIYQSDLAKIGVTANLKGFEGAAATQARNDGRFGVYFTPHPFASLHPATMITSPFFDSRKNYSNYTTDTYQKLSAALLVEADPTRQKALYDQLNDELLSSSFSLVISPAPPIAIASANVHGLRHDLHEALVMREVSIS